MEIKYSKDRRVRPKWERVVSMEFGWGEKKNTLVRTERFGFILLSECTHVRDGNFDKDPRNPSKF